MIDKIKKNQEKLKKSKKQNLKLRDLIVNFNQKEEIFNGDKYKLGVDNLKQTPRIETIKIDLEKYKIDRR